MLEGKCTVNCLFPSFDVASFLAQFQYNGGMLGMNIYKIKT